MGLDGNNNTLSATRTDERRLHGDGIGSVVHGRSEWRLANGLDGVAEIESGGAGLEREFLRGAEWIWDRFDGGVQHGIGKRRSVGDGGDRASGAVGRSDPVADAFAANEFFADESGVLAGGVRGDGGDSSGGGADAVSAIRRSAVVVFSDTTARVMLFRECRFTMRGRRASFWRRMGIAMATITTNTVSPASYPDEVAFLPGVIGDFTNAMMAFVRATQSACRFEVLYPTDTNQTAFNQAINFPVSAWTPAALTVSEDGRFRIYAGAESG